MITMTKRRLKPQFKTYTFLGFVVLWIPWMLLFTYNTFILKSIILQQLLFYVTMIQIGYAIGVGVQAIDNYKQYNELLEHMSEITTTLLIKVNKLLKKFNQN